MKITITMELDDEFVDGDGVSEQTDRELFDALSEYGEDINIRAGAI